MLRMVRSCVFLLFSIVLLVNGDGRVNDSSVEEVTNKIPTHPPPPPSTLLILLNLLGLNLPGNETEPHGRGNASETKDLRAVILVTTVEIPESNNAGDDTNSIANLGKPVKRMAEDASNRKRRSTDTDIDIDSDSLSPLVREKRTFHKKKGCGMVCKMMTMGCGMMGGCPQPQQHPQYTQSCGQPRCGQPMPVYHPPPPPPPPPPKQTCDPCRQRQQQQYHPPPPPPPPPTSCGQPQCGGYNSHSYSHSQASASSMSESWGKKK